MTKEIEPRAPVFDQGARVATPNRHCDDYADSPLSHPAARWFIFIARLPASLHELTLTHVAEPRLFADYQGRRVRVVMASRFGDLGITHDLTADHGYERRVAVDDLQNFSEVP